MRCPFSLAYRPMGVFFGRTTDYNFHLALVPRRNSAREVGGWPSVARVISVGKCVCNIIFAGRRYSVIDNTILADRHLLEPNLGLLRRVQDS